MRRILLLLCVCLLDSALSRCAVATFTQAHTHIRTHTRAHGVRVHETRGEGVFRLKGGLGAVESSSSSLLSRAYSWVSSWASRFGVAKDRRETRTEARVDANKNPLLSIRGGRPRPMGKNNKKNKQHIPPAAAAAAAAAGAGGREGAKMTDNPEEDQGGVPATQAHIAVKSAEELLRGTKGIVSSGNHLYTIEKGFVPGMRTGASFYANEALLTLVLSELEKSGDGGGGFLPAVKQLANVATLPGIVSSSIGMPDIHSGYGFAIGNVAAMNMEDPQAVVSPGGVGFDINCGVRLLRSDLTLGQVEAVKAKLADCLFKSVPVGVGDGSIIGTMASGDLDGVLKQGMKWAEEKGLIWKTDRELVEEGGCFEGADPSCVSSRAKQRGKTQCGSLGSGNHYCEVQVVEEVYNEEAAAAMGLKKGTICVMMHTGSRGLGHQVCTDALQEMDAAMKQQGIKIVDRQLACCRIDSEPGQRYLKAMKCAANFAFVNRSMMAMGVRKAFETIFGKDAATLGLSTVYDVAHNIAKEEVHIVDGKEMKVLVHRKGATRAFGPGHKDIPEKYRSVGQPVLIGGSMGTCSYVLTGTQGAMEQTFGSTCHGAGRAMSRSAAVRSLDAREVLASVERSGCTTRVATKKLAAEEAPESYKDVSEVVQTCHDAGISRLCVKLKPVICVKG